MSERKVYVRNRLHTLFDRSCNPGEPYNIDEVLAPVSDEEAALLNDVDDESVSEIKEIYGTFKTEGLDGVEKKYHYNSKFNLDNVRKLINKMERKNIIKPKNYIANIPFVGRSLYEKAWLEQKKINILKEQLEKAENGTEADRQRFIDELEPLLGKSKN